MSQVTWSALPSPALRLLSLGAGVQSSTLFLMALEGEIDGKLDGAIFADTGWEPESVYRHLAWLENWSEGRIPIHRVSIGNIRNDVLASVDGIYSRNPPFWVKGEDGRAAPLRRKCTSAYKIEPIDRKVRELLGVLPGRRVPKSTVIEKWVGISADEVVRVKPSGRDWIANRYPLIERHMTREDCLRLLTRRGYPPRQSQLASAVPIDRTNHGAKCATSAPRSSPMRLSSSGPSSAGSTGRTSPVSTCTGASFRSIRSSSRPRPNCRCSASSPKNARESVESKATGIGKEPEEVTP